MADQIMLRRVQIQDYLEEKIRECRNQILKHQSCQQSNYDFNQGPQRNECQEWITIDTQGRPTRVSMEKTLSSNKNQYLYAEYSVEQKGINQTSESNLNFLRVDQNLKMQQMIEENRANQIIMNLPKSILQLNQMIDANNQFVCRSFINQIKQIAQKMVDLNVDDWIVYSGVLGKLMQSSLKQEVIQSIFTHNFVNVLYNAEKIVDQPPRNYYYECLNLTTLHYLIQCSEYLLRKKILSNQEELNMLITVLSRLFLTNMPVKEAIKLHFFCRKLIGYPEKDVEDIQFLKLRLINKVFIGNYEISNKMVEDCIRCISLAHLPEALVESLRIILIITQYTNWPEGVNSLFQTQILQLVRICIQSQTSREAKILVLRIFHNLAFNSLEATRILLKSISINDIIAIFNNKKQDSYLQVEVVGLVCSLALFSKDDEQILNTLFDSKLSRLIVCYLKNYEQFDEEATKNMLKTLLIAKYITFSVFEAMAENLNLFEKLQEDQRYSEIVSQIM